MTIGKRLAVLLKEKGMTQKSFSKKINYREQSVSNLITGQTKNPRTDLIIRTVAAFPEVNLRWLLLGEGEMLKEGMSIADETQHELDNLRMENSKLKDKIIELLEK
jgi:transcriptional regulator with XRE-family HTH domain